MEERGANRIALFFAAAFLACGANCIEILYAGILRNRGFAPSSEPDELVWKIKECLSLFPGRLNTKIELKDFAEYSRDKKYTKLLGVTGVRDLDKIMDGLESIDLGDAVILITPVAAGAGKSSDIRCKCNGERCRAALAVDPKWMNLNMNSLASVLANDSSQSRQIGTSSSDTGPGSRVLKEIHDLKKMVAGLVTRLSDVGHAPIAPNTLDAGWKSRAAARTSLSYGVPQRDQGRN